MTLFISHAPEDDAAARRVEEQLGAAGFVTIRLDSDGSDGRPAVGDWERALDHALARSVAVVALVSRHWGQSRWCLAEWTLARALGKPVLAVMVDGDGVPPEVGANEAALIVDVAGGEIADRIVAGLAAAGVARGGPTPHRPPCPGLSPFDEADEFYFVGRDHEVQDVLAAVRRMRTFGRPRVLLLVGPSGSGTSSLLRAGVVPKLRRARDVARVVGPFRPLRADAATVRAQVGEPRSAPAPTFLILDQLEEVLHPGADPSWTELLGELARAESIHVIGAVRSEELVAISGLDAWDGIAVETMPIAMLRPDALAPLLLHWASRAGVMLEDGLVTRIVTDARGTCGLAAVGFTLRELHELHEPHELDELHPEDATSRRLTVDAYERTGGVGGAIERAAESALAGLDDETEAELRAGLLRLAWFDEADRIHRSVARLEEFPTAARAFVERLIAARVLVRGGDGVEVAHEAVFVAWPRLEAWIREMRSARAWARDLRRARERWEGVDRSRGPRLSDAAVARAREHLARGDPPPATEREFLDRCLSDADRRASRRRFLAIGAAVVVVTAILVSVRTFGLYRDAVRDAGSAHARIALIRARAAEDPLEAVRLVLDGLEECPDDDGITAAELHAELDRRAGLGLVVQFDLAAEAHAIRGDERLLVGDVLVDATDGSAVVTLPSPPSTVESVDVDGAPTVRLAFDDGRVELRDARTGELRQQLAGVARRVSRLDPAMANLELEPLGGMVEQERSEAVIGPRETWLLVRYRASDPRPGSTDPVEFGQVYRVSDGSSLECGSSVASLGFMGRHLGLVLDDGRVDLRDLDSGEPIFERPAAALLEAAGGGVAQLALDDERCELRNLATGARLTIDDRFVRILASPDGRHLAVASRGSPGFLVESSRFSGRRELLFHASERSPLETAQFSDDGTILVGHSRGHGFHAWRTTDGHPYGPLDQDGVSDVGAFSPGRPRWLAVVASGRVVVFDVTGSKAMKVREFSDSSTRLRFAADGRLLVTRWDRRVACFDPANDWARVEVGPVGGDVILPPGAPYLWYEEPESRRWSIVDLAWRADSEPLDGSAGRRAERISAARRGLERFPFANPAPCLKPAVSSPP